MEGKSSFAVFGFAVGGADCKCAFPYALDFSVCFVSKDTRNIKQDGSFTDQDGRFKNKDRSFILTDASFINGDRSFKNQDRNFMLTDGSFIKQDGSFIVADGSFINTEASFIKMEKSYNFWDCNSLVIGLLFQNQGFVNLIPLTCLYCGDMAPKIAFTYFLTSDAIFTKPVFSAQSRVSLDILALLYATSALITFVFAV